MTKVEEFIYNYDSSQRDVMLYFHKLLANDLNLTEKIRYKIPFYYNRSWICYLNPLKNGKVEFAFVRGNELSNSHGILDSKGRKQVYSIEFENVTEIPFLKVNEVIQEAILLDETKPYGSKRKSKSS